MIPSPSSRAPSSKARLRLRAADPRDEVRSGYRLEWIDRYTAQEKVRFNVIFRTNHPAQDWASVHNLTGAAYQEKFDGPPRIISGSSTI